MPHTPRRTFLQGTALAAAAWTVGSRTARAAQGDRIVLGVIGPGGMGMNHVRTLCARSDVEIAWVCDVDSKRLGDAAQHVESTLGNRPQTTADMRQVLDDPRVDALFIATPDHWHAPAAILALDAGKHVYVEKPCCHNIREGRLMAEAVKRSGKLLQVGTQSRSTECVRAGIERVHKGEIGEVLVAKAWNSQRRGNIGKTQPTDPPPHLDYDTWCGPAPLVPFNRARFLGTYRWFWDYAGGWVTDYGTHRFDSFRQVMGVGAPLTVAAAGGRFSLQDAGETPDLVQATYEYPGFVMSYESLNMNGFGAMGRITPGMTLYNARGEVDRPNGMAFYGSNGVMIVDRLGYEMIGEEEGGRRTPFRAEDDKSGKTRGPKIERSHMNEEEPTARHGRHFVRCSFNFCNLVYSGGPVGLVECGGSHNALVEVGPMKEAIQGLGAEEMREKMLRYWGEVRKGLNLEGSAG